VVHVLFDEDLVAADLGIAEHVTGVDTVRPGRRLPAGSRRR
jgi:hypothetical protein